MNNDLIMLSCCVFSESKHAWLGIKCLIKRLVSVFDSLGAQVCFRLNSLFESM